MGIIHYLFQPIQYLYQQKCWLLHDINSSNYPSNFYSFVLYIYANSQDAEFYYKIKSSHLKNQFTKERTTEWTKFKKTHFKTLPVKSTTHWWTADRSLSYLCSIFQNLESGDDYSDVKPAYHIGILDFSPFPDYPEFYATNKMMNVKKHYIYNDNFTLNVLDLNQIHLATEEDKAYEIDYWAKFFKAKTWEDLKMLAQKNDAFEETCETVYKLNQD